MTPTSHAKRQRVGSLLAVSVLLWAALVVLVATPGIAHAHTELTGSVPAAGAESGEPVDAIVLTFSRPVELLEGTILIRGAEGRVSGVTRTEDGTVVTASVDPPLRSGAWTVAWRILAEDSHPRTGEFAFSVTEPAAAPSNEAEGASDARADPVAPRVRQNDRARSHASPATASGDARALEAQRLDLIGAVARAVMYLGLMTAAGLALFASWPHRGQLDGARQLATWTAVTAAIAFIASAVEVATHVGSVSGRGFAGMLDTSTWRPVLRTGLGTALVARSTGLLLLTLGGVVRRVRSVPSGPDALKLTGALLAIASFQFVGHTTSSSPEALVRTADAVHALAAATWIGGLTGLAILSRHGVRRGRAIAAARFSTAATYAVLGVATAGAALAFTHIPSLEAVSATAYGQILVAKLAVVAGLGAIGAYNHLRVVPALTDGDDRALDRLRRTVRVEVALAIVILSLTAVLVNTPPPAG